MIAQKAREARQKRITEARVKVLRRYEMRGYLTFLWERSIFEVDYALLEDWLAWLEDAKPNLSPKTRRNMLTDFGGFLRWLRKRKQIREVPELPEIPVDEHSPILIDERTQDSVLEAIQEEARGFFLALARMGLRPGEARVLNTSDYRDGFLTVARGAKDEHTEGAVRGTKSRRVRRLPVDSELAEWIERDAKGRARIGQRPLFSNPRGQTASKRWSPSAYRRTWNRACIEALGHRVAPPYEGTRHSFATGALGRDVDLHHVQRFLGHSDPRTTQRHYARPADTALVSVLRPKGKS